jgi:hypothetical protein
MNDKPKFSIEPVPTNVEPEEEVGRGTASHDANDERASISGFAASSDKDDDLSRLGEELALHVEAAECHPVILFGSRFTGKTSLLLSLLAAIKTEPRLRTGLMLGAPLLDNNTEVGKRQYEAAEEIFGKKTQQFIEGVKPKATGVENPFFIPLDFLPYDKPEAKLALMESNGEWYVPDRSSAKLFRPLNKHIEDFIGYYQAPITFIHVLPFTQNANTSLSPTEKVHDGAAIQDASLAISGALQAYERIRIDKGGDRHLLLVTKWDARERAGLNKEDSLSSTTEEVAEFVEENYAQAFAAFEGMRLREDQKFIAGYCSGLMNEVGVLVLKRSNDIRLDVLSYPINLWKWLYANAQAAVGLPEQDPFPSPKPLGPVEKFLNWLNKLLK